MQINRLFEIIYILMQQKFITANELAARLGVSKRTIYRDIDALSLSNIPIYAERGKGGGFGLLPNFVLNKSLLNEQEQNEILTALHSISNIKADETTHVLNKLSAIFNKTADDWLELDFSAWGGVRNLIFFNNFKAAILERRIVTFNYYNQNGEMTFRRVEPMKLWFKSHSWYIKGFCLTKQDMRIYKMSRVENLAVTDEYFTKRVINTQSDTSEEYSRSEQTPVLRFRILPEMTYRVFDYFNESSIERQSDGSFIVKASWPEDNWVYGFVLSFGKYIEVLEPIHLRNIIKNTALEIAKIYL